MDTYEHKGRLTYKDENGDLHRLYPVTKAECVEGLVVGESVLYAPQNLTDEQKAQARKNIGVGSDISLPDVSSEDEGKVLKVVDGEWKVGEVGASEAPDTNHPVTSVNGMTGDVIIDIPEVGVPEKVQADWNQNDSAQPDFVKNRTHWEENNQTVIEWDCSADGRDVFAFSSEDIIKVADATPTLTELVGGSLRVASGGEEYTGIITEDGIIEYDGFVYVTTDAGIFYVITKINIVIDGETFTAPSTGIYMPIVYTEAEDDILITFTYGSTTVHKLDPKYLPDGGFGWEENNQTVIEWDGDITGKTVFENVFYKVSDITPSVEEFTNVVAMQRALVDGSWVEEPVPIPAEVIEVSLDGGVIQTSVVLIVNLSDADREANSLPSADVLPNGLYLYCVPEGMDEDIQVYMSKLTYGSVAVHQIDEKFIPDTIARKSDILSGGGVDESILMEAVESALQESKESGMFDGADGVTYIPAIRSDGYLEWSNTAGAPNPAPAKVKGDSGKSAYSYAQEGGYTGTEEEFAEMLAKDTGGLPLPLVAEVGQFIVVSAVDENGKVTATEAITLEDAEEVAF